MSLLRLWQCDIAFLQVHASFSDISSAALRPTRSRQPACPDASPFRPAMADLLSSAVSSSHERATYKERVRPHLDLWLCGFGIRSPSLRVLGSRGGSNGTTLPLSSMPRPRSRPRLPRHSKERAKAALKGTSWGRHPPLMVEQCIESALYNFEVDWGGHDCPGPMTGPCDVDITRRDKLLVSISDVLATAEKGRVILRHGLQKYADLLSTAAKLRAEEVTNSSRLVLIHTINTMGGH
ncbi:hypothetical protein F5X68DRAFT_218257 [Plectosphaerella plurivora]|uniref:Uncharacterized protein n=1 Tax=Plectosphaerella plurivora TaxID=936078 RepID=A0A9P8V183_9PEZI|nr:hypothetical protein F5X68DRAFT_218257 [Plectosphaerella plurivora]